MKKVNSLLVLLSSVLCLEIYPSNCFAQENREIKVYEYEASSEFPFGRLNPNTPSEAAQFDFMIGKCECIDEIKQEDGSWQKSDKSWLWQTQYVMNGYGVMDWGRAFRSIRVFDKKQDKWVVTFISAHPEYFSGIWKGGKAGNEIVLLRNERDKGIKYVKRLTFYNISKEGFDWKAESVYKDGSVKVNGMISCQKKVDG